MGAQLGRRVDGDALLRGVVLQLGEVGHQQRDDVLAPVADYNCVGDEGAGLELVLNRLRGNHLAGGGLDEVFLAVGNGEEAFVVQETHVAGVEPAVPQHLAGFLFQLVVALHDVGPTSQDFAVVGDLHLHAWNRFSHCAQLGRAGDVQGDHGRGFGQAVTFINHQAHSVEELVERL